MMNAKDARKASLKNQRARELSTEEAHVKATREAVDARETSIKALATHYAQDLTEDLKHAIKDGRLFASVSTSFSWSPEEGTSVFFTEEMFAMKRVIDLFQGEGYNVNMTVEENMSDLKYVVRLKVMW